MSFTDEQHATINEALAIIEQTYQRESLEATGTSVVRKYCQLLLGYRECEHFVVLYLDSQHRLINTSFLFRGTIDAATVYPREVVKEALGHNAHSVILSHNHPSGKTNPSTADIQLTEKLVNALQLVDIRVLDHIIVSAVSHYSFAEEGHRL